MFKWQTRQKLYDPNNLNLLFLMFSELQLPLDVNYGNVPVCKNLYCDIYPHLSINIQIYYKIFIFLQWWTIFQIVFAVSPVVF